MTRRILAAALPHLAAEARLRREGQSGQPEPFAIAERAGGALRLVSVNPAAAALGLAPGLGLADARALCPALLTRPAEPGRLDAFRRALARWAEAFSPLVSLGGDDTLVLDATGCAHLFGGEAAMLEALTAGLTGLGLTARAAMADTKGAAWALAQFGGGEVSAPPGQTRAAIAALPVAALRLEPEAAAGLAAVGLNAIGDLAGVPRGALARRFGLAAVRRLDQALGAEPEPVAPARARPVFAARLTLPEPIGLTGDLEAGLGRLLERLCALLETNQTGARSLRLTARRVDGADVRAAIALARPNRDPARLGALFAPKLAEIDAGFGIDALRLEATRTEPLTPAQVSHLVTRRNSARPGHQPGHQPAVEPLDDLLSRLGNRIGFDRLIRLLPAESHIPERAFTLAAAAWSGPETFPEGGPARPLTLFPPEPLEAGEAPRPGPDPEPDPGPRAVAPKPSGSRIEPGTWDKNHPPGHPPVCFRWRGRWLTLAAAQGPERIAPEWWWDDPAWRSGTRDYWRAETAEGPRLWLFHTPQADRPKWWVHGEFA